EGQLDRTPAVEPLPHGQLDVEVQPRATGKHRRIALPRIDAPPLNCPQAERVADARPHAEVAPVPLPAGDEERKDHHHTEEYPAPRLLGDRPHRHRLPPP